jgi:hypothetical protein
VLMTQDREMFKYQDRVALKAMAVLPGEGRN